MLTEKEIALELIQVVNVMVDKKSKNENDMQSKLAMGCAFGLLIALDRSQGFMEADNQLGYLNKVLSEILGEPSESSPSLVGEMSL